MALALACLYCLRVYRLLFCHLSLFRAEASEVYLAPYVGAGGYHTFSLTLSPGPFLAL